jgi:hypothetical protein
MNKSMTTWMVGIAFCCAISIGLSGCATTAGLPSAQPMPDGADYGGLWYSDQFEHMYLHREGDRVTGVYAYGSGGTLEGEVDGNRLVFSWHEPGDRSELRRDRSGHGYFRLVDGEGGPELVGEWGYDADHRGGGPWTAEFIRESEPTDPKTIEAINDIH